MSTEDEKWKSARDAMSIVQRDMTRLKRELNFQDQHIKELEKLILEVLTDQVYVPSGPGWATWLERAGELVAVASPDNTTQGEK